MLKTVDNIPHSSNYSMINNYHKNGRGSATIDTSISKCSKFRLNLILLPAQLVPH